MIKKFLFIFGTRPEAIKLAIPIKLFKADSRYDVKVCVTGQQRELLDQMLTTFDLKPDYDLDLMTKNQNLHHLTSNIINATKEIIEKESPDLVFVHGDTTTAFASALSAFYKSVPVAHVEAGLRTYNIYSPYPEEANRQLISKLATFNFCPTNDSKKNLLNEANKQETITVTGNTGLDALFWMKENIPVSVELNQQLHLSKKDPLVLITFHRRENHNEATLTFCHSLKNIAQRNPDCKFIFPVHLNPNVKDPINQYLSNVENIYLLEPMDYQSFTWCLINCYFVITDSGGVQEEATSLGTPVLLYRDTTERPEGVNCNNIKLVKGQNNLLEKLSNRLFSDKDFYQKMAIPSTVFGDGKASIRIKDFLDNYYGF